MVELLEQRDLADCCAGDALILRIQLHLLQRDILARAADERLVYGAVRALANLLNLLVLIHPAGGREWRGRRRGAACLPLCKNPNGFEFFVLPERTMVCRPAVPPARSPGAGHALRPARRARDDPRRLWNLCVLLALGAGHGLKSLRSKKLRATAAGRENHRK